MRWKEIIIGALSTLIVTILAGVAIYYWTKEPDSKKNEVLEYSTEQVAQFKGSASSLSLTTIKVYNRGGVSAEEVRLTVEYPSETISDTSFESISGARTKTQTIDKSKVDLKFESLLPEDSIVLSLLTSSSDLPKITLRSAKSIGKPIVIEGPPSKQKQKINQILSYIVPVSSGITVILAGISYYLNRRISRRRLHEPKRYDESKNNTGFLLLHQGAVAEAEPILRAAVLQGETGVIALANLAFCLALLNNVQESKTMLTAARFFVSALGGIAIVSFNEALIALLGGDRDEFYRKLSEAIQLDKEEIKLYCEYSIYVEPVRTEQRYMQIMRNV